MLDDQTGELVERELQHEGEQVREFYSGLPKPVLVGLEATGSMHWFLRLLEDLAIEFRVGHPAKIRAAEQRVKGLSHAKRQKPHTQTRRDGAPYGGNPRRPGHPL